MMVNGLMGPFVFMILTGVLGFVVSLILFISHNEKTLGNRLLALSIASISYVLLINATFLTNFYQIFPITYRSLSFITFCIAPFSYLYVRTVLNQAYRLSKSDIFFFLPALLALINRIPFFLMSRSEQIQHINEINLDLKKVVLEPDGLLPPGYLAMLRIIMTLVFTIAQMRLIIKWTYKMDHNKALIKQNEEILQWLKLFSVLLLVSSSLLFVQTFLQVSSSFHFEQIIIFTMGLTNLAASIMLFASPKILYGMVGWMQENEPKLSLQEFTRVTAKDEIAEPQRQSLTLYEGRNYTKKLIEYFSTEKSYLEPGYTINDLSKALNIPVYQLSSFINQEYKKSFIQFLNDQRFEYLINMKKEDPDFNNYTIDYLGKKIGFNSRTSFVSFIKKRTGKTPSEFLKEA